VRFIVTNSFGTDQTNSQVSFFRNNYREHHSLLRALWKIARKYYFAAAVWEMLYIIARVALPMALRRLLIVIQTAQEGESIVKDALASVIVMAVAGFMVALCQGRSVFLSTQAGIAVRAVLTSVIYEHALQLTPRGRMGLTTGTITNMVATDSQKLYDVLLEGQNLWSCPVLIIVVAVLLWMYIGPELVLGIVVLILFLPIIKVIVGTMLTIRKERSKLTDRRIQIITSMLQGILVTKLNHYEKMVGISVMAVRDQEMSLLSKELRMWGLVLTTAVSSPILAFGVAITFFVLSANNNILQPSDAFSALLFFSILRFPVNLAARLVGKAAQALDSIRRIDRFLQRDTRKEISNLMNEQDNHEQADDILLRVQNGHFILQPEGAAITTTAPTSLDKQQNKQGHGFERPFMEAMPPFQLQNIDLQVRKGQLVVVVGRIGSGKSTLLKALLGELPSDDSVRIRGTLSYASQEPFIMNASFRENICFGNEYDKVRYEEVIDATDLRPDIARLGASGDLSQIGERGVTLSGGQKQRVALARAIYANATLALLDDCFSALDPSTARRVFDSLFRAKHGILRRGGSILVTHALHFLTQADLILILEQGSPIFLGTFEELRELETKSESVETSMVEQIQDASQDMVAHLHHHGVTERDGVIMTIEEREYGKAGYAIWVEWARNAGGWSFILSQTLFLCLDRGIYVAGDWWIALWSQGWQDGVSVFGMDFPPQTDGDEAQVQYVCIYLCIITLSVLATLLRSLWASKLSFVCVYKCSR
jgi:ABC-type multidrug transport system fused ATPase/permease subunit